MGTRIDIVQGIEKTLKEEKRTDIKHDYEHLREHEENKDPVGLVLSENDKKLKRQLTFRMRFGIGDKAVKLQYGTLIPCIISGIESIKLKGDIKDGNFDTIYKIIELQTGENKTCYGSTLLTVEEAITRLMLFGTISGATTSNIIEESLI